MQSLTLTITDKATGHPVDEFTFAPTEAGAADDRIRAACENHPHVDLHVRIDGDVSLATIDEWTAV